MKGSAIGVCLGLILAIHVGVLAWGARAQSPTIDEIAYLPAGLSHWQLGNFELANVSPPLIRTIAATPLLVVGAETNWRELLTHLPGARISHAVGSDFVQANGPRSLWLFTLARWALIPLSVLGAVCCYLWARDLSGPGAGLCSACLWCFCPNVLAHAQLVTADAGATALCVAAAYMFWRWLKSPTWVQALLAGIALGLAESAKTTLLVLVVLWPLLWLAWNWPTRRSTSRTQWKRGAAQIGLILVLAWYVLNLAYAFDGSFKRLDRFVFVSRTFTGDLKAGAIGNRFTKSWLGAIPVPFPEQYVLGIDSQKRDLENVDPTYRGGPYRSYLRGEWSNRGWWYYYLYAMAVKVPLGTWLVIAVAICWRPRAAVAGLANWRDDLVLLAPLVTILAFVSSQTGFSMHFRYVLPILPFAFIWISQSVRATLPRSLTRNLAIAAGLAWSIASSLWAAPHHLSYFNELAGGPFGGHFHLTESNIDWGQDLLYLEKWIDAHPEALPMHVAYLGLFPPKLARIDFPPPVGSPASGSGIPAAPELRPGWYAISIGYVQGNPYGGERHLEYFQKLKPTAFAGYSIYLYYIPTAG
ncbi:MAG TPA: glycosyltransferase family 39 protein [Planctomycetaceae bacterium]|jgi:hypothetical protein|nr:glycosyltransferase family 39 protein [Planctomycetaceae bacterium]